MIIFWNIANTYFLRKCWELVNHKLILVYVRCVRMGGLSMFYVLEIYTIRHIIFLEIIFLLMILYFLLYCSVFSSTNPEIHQFILSSHLKLIIFDFFYQYTADNLFTYELLISLH